MISMSLGYYLHCHYIYRTIQHMKYAKENMPSRIFSENKIFFFIFVDINVFFHINAK